MRPTQFPELNDLLRDLVTRVEAILGGNFVGAYLTGSFALGAADLQSDCDFLVVTAHRVTDEQERGTLEHGEIESKRASLEWARDALAPEWRGLIQQAIDDRALGFDRDDPPRQGTVDATLAFAEYAKERAQAA